MANGLKNYLSFFLFNNTFRGFFFFFLIASILWLLSGLSEQYIYDIKIPVVYTDSDGSTLPKSYNKDTLSVKIKASGFKLLKLKLEKPVFKYRLSSDKTRQWQPENKKNKIKKIFGEEIKILEIQPEKIQMNHKEIFQKKVPISLQLDINYKEGYKNTSPPTIQPSTIKIFGKKEIINKIDSIKTKKIKLKEISSNISQKVNLKLPESIKSNTTEITIKIPVDQLVEKEETLPILLPKSLSDQHLIILPNKSKITYTFFKKDFNKIKNIDLKLEIDTEDLKKNGNRAKIKLLNKTPEILKYKINPKHVTVLIKKIQND